ncbi:hypothetical protein K4F52_001455 [Lecanicillium sp. MT-2017a]|nr:hypothetical protein K4F52_001455 [Lecanicillium sp. MT-2017a]
MRVAIAPAGTKTSAATIRWLLKNAARKETEVYAVYRDLAKVPAEFTSHASFHAVKGDVEDAASLDFAGCDSVLTCTPPSFDGSDPIEKAALMAENVRSAVEKAGVKRLMLLSSIGAEFSEGVGEIRTNHAAEQALRTTNVPEILFVRCGYFMENWTVFGSATLKAQPSPYFESLITPLDWKIPMVAVDDIGSTLATGLTSGYTPPRKPYVFALHGPTDYAPLDVQAALSEAMGKSVELRPVERDKIRAFYEALSFPPQAVDLFAEMATSFLPGGIAEPDAPGMEKVDVVRGKTTLDVAMKAAVDAGL